MGKVSLDNVTKEYPGGIIGAEDVSVNIDDGEFVVLVGPSGCGKTTTLELISGLQQPTSGTIKIGGEVVNDKKPQNRDIAMVFQDYALYPHKTVRENMKFGLKYTTDLSDEEMVEHVENNADILGINHLLDQKPGQLSGGQQQRVALGRAIVRSPEVFLLDEPLSNLDAKLRTQMRAELQELQNQLDVTAVYVTHDQTEAMTMGDRIVIMNEGHVQQIGTPTEVYNHPANAFVAQFIGSPSMNIVEGTIEGNAFNSDSFRYKFEDNSLEEHEGDTVQFGIRPEDMEVIPNQNGGTAVAQVTVVEKLGSENLIHLRFESGAEFVARVNEDILPEIGDEVEIQMPEHRVCLFNPRGDTFKHRNVYKKKQEI